MHIVQEEKHFQLHFKAFLLGIVLSALGLTVGGLIWLNTTYQDRFFDGISIDQVDVSRLTKDQAIQKLSEQKPIFTHIITLRSEGQSIASSAAELGLHRNSTGAVEQAFQVGRSDDYLRNLSEIAETYLQGKIYTSALEFEPEKVQEFVTTLAVQSHSPGEEAKAVIQNGAVTIFPGKKGRSIPIEDTVIQLLSAQKNNPIDLTVTMVPSGTELDAVQIEQAKFRAEKYLGKSIEAKQDVTTVILSDADLVSTLTFPQGINRKAVDSLIDKIQEKVDRPAQNAKFTYDPNTLKVTEFVPDLDGRTIDEIKTSDTIASTMQSIEAGATEKVFTIELIAAIKKADITLATSNNLGINERIGFGESYYAHSIPTRIHNVSQASKIINNTIVKPGEEFSFNKALGDVSAASGFKPAYVIKSGQTVLGDGGGVCQVSTTLFRALLDSGLNITKRKAHSYRVSYYELNRDPGFDATVYAGDVDLRFVNDSPNHVLLHFETFPSQTYMYVSIYGTDDGRTAEIIDYKKWDARGAPAAQYFDDPTLPPGKLVQIDWAVGGIKAQFTHRVKDKAGNIIRENSYYSNYIPWAAKYRRGV